MGHIARQTGALAVAAVTAAATVNGYRPLARSGYLSLWSWAFGLVVTELPLQTLASQLGGLALTARRLTRPVRLIAWLVAGLSALGLLNFSRAGHRANVVLTAALDAGLGARRRTDTAVCGVGQPAAAPPRRRGCCACCGSIGNTHTTPTSATAYTAARTTWISGGVPIWIGVGRRRCCSKSPAVPGRWETNAARPIH
jgi:hypothetical protein